MKRQHLSLAESALRACRQYHDAMSEVDRLTEAIGEALGRCQRQLGAAGTHLGILYKVVRWSPPDDGRPLASDEIEQVLADGIADEDMSIGIDGVLLDEQYTSDQLRCEHCLRAHRLIQERKQARRRLGAAKGFVRRVGGKGEQS